MTTVANQYRRYNRHLLGSRLGKIFSYVLQSPSDLEKFSVSIVKLYDPYD